MKSLLKIATAVALAAFLVWLDHEAMKPIGIFLNITLGAAIGVLLKGQKISLG